MAKTRQGGRDGRVVEMAGFRDGGVFGQVGASIWNGGHGSRLTLDHDTAWSRVVEAARGDVSRATLVA